MAAPFIDPADDAQHFGPPDSMIRWTPAQRVAGFRNIDRIFATHRIEAGDDPYPLRAADSRIDRIDFEFGGERFGIGRYMDVAGVAGLLVIHDDRILLERYGLGNDADTLWVGFSIAKSVVSLLIGAAIRDGLVGNVDEPVTAYLPGLRDSVYDGVTIENLLQMASGVRWDENYADPAADVNNYPWYDADALYRFMGGKPRVAPAGTRFNYNSGEASLLSEMLIAAIGEPLSTYLTRKIWQPFGMEAGAHWLVDSPGGHELGGCCISATLRDFGRLGIFAMHGATVPGNGSIVPAGWMDRSVTPSAGNHQYGYLWWLGPGDAFKAEGVFGQLIYIDPARELVVVKLAAADAAWSQRDRDRDQAFVAAVVAAISDNAKDPVEPKQADDDEAEAGKK